MICENMDLSLGIFIIGSLYWDECESRKSWRNDRFIKKSESESKIKRIDVKAPIRYGRKSSGRGDTYTMVFSQALTLTENSKKLGRGIVIPCKKQVKSANDLITEAECLWTAERKEKESNGCISAKWGCICLIVNPNSHIPDSLLEKWKERVNKESNYGCLTYAKGEEKIVSDCGLLEIPWPDPLNGEQLNLDMLLATATDPTLINDKRYPDAEEIVYAWNIDKKNNVQYFWKNIENGITTFQDKEIEKLLRDCKLA